MSPPSGLSPPPPSIMSQDKDKQFDEKLRKEKKIVFAGDFLILFIFSIILFLLFLFVSVGILIFSPSEDERVKGLQSN